MSAFDAYTAEAAGHTAAAIRHYRLKTAPAAGLGVPDDLVRIEEDAAVRAMRGQQGSPLDRLWGVVHVEPVALVEPLLLTTEEVCRRLAVSESTVKRLMRSGQLPSVLAGGCRRFKPSDVAAYVDSLTHERNLAC